MTTALSIALLLALAQILRQRRNARRRYGQLLCEHKAELARHGMRRFAEGLLAAREPVALAAVAFCEAHREDYEDCLNSDSLDIDPEFLLLGHAVFGKPVKDGESWVIPT